MCVIHCVYSLIDTVTACFLTMCVSMERVHGYSPLMKVLISVALLCVPLAGWLVAVTGTIHTALVGIWHFNYPKTNRCKSVDNRPGKNNA